MLASSFIFIFLALYPKYWIRKRSKTRRQSRLLVNADTLELLKRGATDIICSWATRRLATRQSQLALVAHGFPELHLVGF
jgi:hypothetical protein